MKQHCLVSYLVFFQRSKAQVLIYEYCEYLFTIVEKNENDKAFQVI